MVSLPIAKNLTPLMLHLAAMWPQGAACVTLRPQRSERACDAAGTSREQIARDRRTSNTVAPNTAPSFSDLLAALRYARCLWIRPRDSPFVHHYSFLFKASAGYANRYRLLTLANRLAFGPAPDGLALVLPCGARSPRPVGRRLLAPLGMGSRLGLRRFGLWPRGSLLPASEVFAQATSARLLCSGYFIQTTARSTPADGEERPAAYRPCQ